MEEVLPRSYLNFMITKDELISDIEELKDRKISIGKLRDKYAKVKSVSFSTNELTKYVLLNKDPDIFVDKVFYGDQRDKQITYLLKTKMGYEVFDSERGGKHFLETFDNINDGLKEFLKRILNEIGLLNFF